MQTSFFAFHWVLNKDWRHQVSSGLSTELTIWNKNLRNKNSNWVDRTSISSAGWVVSMEHSTGENTVEKLSKISPMRKLLSNTSNSNTNTPYFLLFMKRRERYCEKWALINTKLSVSFPWCLWHFHGSNVTIFKVVLPIIQEESWTKISRNETIILICELKVWQSELIRRNYVEKLIFFLETKIYRPMFSDIIHFCQVPNLLSSKVFHN